MSKNLNYLNDAKAIFDDLEIIGPNNLATESLIRQGRLFIEDEEGRLAFDFATRAKTMQDYNAK